MHSADHRRSSTDSHQNLRVLTFSGSTQCSKIGKKCNFKSAKKALFAFSKMAKKSIFALEKSLKLPKMQYSD